MSEPDYEQIQADRDEDRAERRMIRDDARYGVKEQYISGPRRRCPCGKLWGAGQREHGCRLLEPARY